MEMKLLKVIERHQLLMLAVHWQVTIKEVAKRLGPSLRHTKRLIKKLREAGGELECLLFQRRHQAWNKFPENVRRTVIALKEERPTRSNPFISELTAEMYGIKFHPTTVRKILIEAGKYTRS